MAEILGAVFLAGDHSQLKPTLQVKPIKVYANGIVTQDGQTLIDPKQGKPVKVLEKIDLMGYYNTFTKQLSYKKQSAKVASFDEQKIKWRKPPRQ